MKKSIIAVAVVAAGAVAYASYLQTNPSSSDSNALLQYIPAHSPMASFQTEAYDPSVYLRANGYAQVSVVESIQRFQEQQAELLASDGEYEEPEKLEFTPTEQFLIDFIDGYLRSAESSQAMQQYMGTPEKVAPVFYTLGLIPVYKIQLADPAAFWKTVDEKEKAAGATHTTKTLGDVEYRSYELTEVEQGIKLVLSVNKENTLTITVDAPALDAENPLKLALGLELPQESLATSNKIADLRAKYGQETNAFAYLDNVEIVKGLTSTDANRLARQFEIMNQKKSAPEEFLALRSAGCKAELTSFANNWPREVVAAQYGVNGETLTMKGRFAIESNNTNMLKALQSLRGFVPTMASDKESLFAGGVGLNVAQLAPAITTIWNEFAQPKYTCGPLAEMQASIMEENPASMMGLVSGMLNGFEGISANLIDMTPAAADDFGVMFDKLDGVVALTAQNPAMILQSFALFDPRLAQLDLKPGDAPVDVSDLLASDLGEESKIKAYAQMSEHHLVIYTGDKGKKAAEKLLAEPMSENGLVTFSMNTDRLQTIMQEEDAADAADIELLGQPSGTTTFNVEDGGIVLDFDYVSKQN